MRRFILIALGSAVLATAIVSVPPAPRAIAAGDDIPEPVRGSIHVHTRRSDGSGTVEQVAAAASRAGLAFVVLADHGDGSRHPDRPVYIHGVLCIDAVEISTFNGHVLAIGLTNPAPYLLGGDARDVVEDVGRLGGMTIAAHPGSLKPQLAWTEWNAPIDGIEWLNADSEWRDESAIALARAVIGYPWRRPQALATLLDRPARTLTQWDAMTAHRPVVAIAGSDAHANLGLAEASNPYGDRILLAVPGYEPVFRTFSVALPGVALSGNAEADAATVVDAIRAGRLYSSIDAFGAPARLDFTASSGRHIARQGERLPIDGPVVLRVRTTSPDGARVSLLQGGAEVASSTDGAIEYTAPASRGVFRVEVSLPGASATAAPWLLSNPIYVGGFVAPPRRATRTRGRTVPAHADGPRDQIWGIEKNDASNGVLEFVPLVEGTRRRLRYALGGRSGDGIYVALAMNLRPDLPAFDRLVITAGADKPMRVWLQLRQLVPNAHHYWQRSISLDSTVREIIVPLDEFRGAGDAPADVQGSDIASVLYLVDGTHTPIGSGGQVWIDDVRVGR